jgi:hypothetical protein
VTDDTGALLRFLATDPAAADCAETADLLHVYAELLDRDADAAALYPRIAAHVRACGPCAEDLAGLLAAIGDRLG